MANFKGHALPGSFFLLFGLWWSVKYPLRHLSQKASKKSQRNYCFQRVDAIEGAVKIVFALIGKGYIRVAVLVACQPVVMAVLLLHKGWPLLQRNWPRCGRMHLLNGLGL